MINVSTGSINEVLPCYSVRFSVAFDCALHLCAQLIFDLVLARDSAERSTVLRKAVSLQDRKEVRLFLSMMVPISKRTQELH
jgi:hypothetical protein